jgi:hypothetical protein
MRGMTRFCVLVGLLALSVASCSKVSTPMPLPSGLAKEWRLVKEVVDGETQPPFAEGMWIEIISDIVFIHCDYCNGTINFPSSDGIN